MSRQYTYKGPSSNMIPGKKLIHQAGCFDHTLGIERLSRDCESIKHTDIPGISNPKAMCTNTEYFNQ